LSHYQDFDEEARMNIKRLSGGIICLALAALLAVLPADKVVFMVDGTNAPIVPTVVLAALGLALLITSVRR
jgi:hypothetical protein